MLPSGAGQPAASSTAQGSQRRLGNVKGHAGAGYRHAGKVGQRHRQSVAPGITARVVVGHNVVEASTEFPSTQAVHTEGPNTNRWSHKSENTGQYTTSKYVIRLGRSSLPVTRQAVLLSGQVHKRPLGQAVNHP